MYGMTVKKSRKNKKKTVKKIDPTINSKIQRIQLGNSLRVLDLFSGCGGLSLGFKKAGYEIVASVECEKDAVASHATNFHKNDKSEIHRKPRDIQKIEPSTIFDELGLKGASRDQIDIIIGGPPCQAFTRIGRAKLREISSDSNAFLNDPRSQLYKRYLEYVRELKPLAILMENVPDILNYGGVNIADKVCDDLVSYGYKCQYTLLNTVFYGVPQMRERMFLIAIHQDVDVNIAFPKPSHYIELPKGYHGSRNVALKNIINSKDHKYYLTPPRANKALPKAVTAEDALSDLPQITGHLTGQLKRGIKKTTELIQYGCNEGKNEYQRLMRSWPSFESNNTVSGNVIRYLPRDYPIFRKMQPGDQYPEAIKIAEKIFDQKLKLETSHGHDAKPTSARYKRILKETIPPYDASKFPNKWRKMEADKPARTLMAHLGKDSYSHIHFDSEQARTISVREAARLQSFPDGYQFSGAMNAAFRQIGNAVPPLMAEKLALSIKKSLIPN